MRLMTLDPSFHLNPPGPAHRPQKQRAKYPLGHPSSIQTVHQSALGDLSFLHQSPRHPPLKTERVPLCHLPALPHLLAAVGAGVLTLGRARRRVLPPGLELLPVGRRLALRSDLLLLVCAGLKSTAGAGT